MGSFTVRPGLPGDNAALQALFAVSQPSSGMELAFERGPDYFQSARVMYQHPELMVVTHRDSPDGLAAAFNYGHKEVFVNGEARLARYGADMRIAPAYHGSRALFTINRAVEPVLRHDWYYTVILDDNGRSRNAFEHGRAGLPGYRRVEGLTTYTMTRRRGGRTGLPAVRPATAADIPAMNALVRRLASRFQFLPTYDFAQLGTDDAYYYGLTLSDFLLVDGEDGLRGLVGLWNQSAFKQTRVTAYRWPLNILRPLWNLWAGLAGGIQLPPAGGALAYRSLHSPLTAPEDVEAFAALLNAAWNETRRQGVRALALTLADNDPRQAEMACWRTLPMKAHLYTVAYRPEHHPELDSTLVPLLDSGRL